MCRPPSPGIWQTRPSSVPFIIRLQKTRSSTHSGKTNTATHCGPCCTPMLHSQHPLFQHHCRHVIIGLLLPTTSWRIRLTTQKNGVRGELIGLGRSGHPTWCPVKTLINRIQHLRQQNAPPTTPLYSYFDGSWRRIDTTILTHYLRLAVTTLGHQYGISAPDVSIRSLRSSGAMALLCAKVDTDMIRLLGRWRSDEMLRYLHVQSFPLVAPLASQMLHHGHFTLMPNQINGG